MSYPSDLTDDQWDLLEPVFNAPGKRGRKHADDLRTVVDAMLYIAQTGCQWRYLPESFGPWTRVWSQFRRWSRNGTWAQALTVLHAAARAGGRAGRADALDGRHRHPPGPRRVERRVHLPRPRRPLRPHQGRQARRRRRRDRPPGGRAGRARLHPRESGQRADAGAPDPAGRHRPARAGPGGPRGHAAAARTLGRDHDVEVRRVGWDDKQPVFRPIRHAWRVEVAHGRLGRSRRLAKSFENTTTSATGWLQVACIATTLRHLSRDRAADARSRSQLDQWNRSTGRSVLLTTRNHADGMASDETRRLDWSLPWAPSRRERLCRGGDRQRHWGSQSGRRSSRPRRL